eukprot:gene1822-12848_t
MCVSTLCRLICMKYSQLISVKDRLMQSHMCFVELTEMREKSTDLQKQQTVSPSSDTNTRLAELQRATDAIQSNKDQIKTLQLDIQALQDQRPSDGT